MSTAMFVDFCLGDTGGMAGHAQASVDAIARQAARASR